MPNSSYQTFSLTLPKELLESCCIRKHEETSGELIRNSLIKGKIVIKARGESCQRVSFKESRSGGRTVAARSSAH